MTVAPSFFYYLIPLSIVGFYYAYRVGRIIFCAPLILELPFLQKEATFKIVKHGKYCIWDKGKQLMNVPLNQFGFQIKNLDNGQIIPLSNIFLRTTQSGFKTASRTLYSFRASVGNYKFEIVNGTIGNPVELTIQKLIPSVGSQFDPSRYSILIKDHYNPLWIMAFVWLLILSTFALLLGIILPNAL